MFGFWSLKICGALVLFVLCAICVCVVVCVCVDGLDVCGCLILVSDMCVSFVVCVLFVNLC